MNALPGLPLPGCEDLRGGVGVWLGGGQEDDGRLLPLHLAVGQAAHGDAVGSTCQVHLTEEIEQILRENNISQSSGIINIFLKLTVSPVDSSKELFLKMIFSELFLSELTFDIFHFLQISDLSNSIRYFCVHIKRRSGGASCLSWFLLVLNLQNTPSINRL